MSFGKKLKEECNKVSTNKDLAKQVYEKLKPVLLECAKSRKKGCKINFIYISESAKKDLLQLVKADDIIVIENQYFIWDDSIGITNNGKTPNPCSKCGLGWNCCGCIEKTKWDKWDKEVSKFYSSLPTITIIIGVVRKNYTDDKIQIKLN